MSATSDRADMVVILLPPPRGVDQSEAPAVWLARRVWECRDAAEAARMLNWLEANGIGATRTTKTIADRWLRAAGAQQPRGQP